MRRGGATTSGSCAPWTPTATTAGGAATGMKGLTTGRTAIASCMSGKHLYYHPGLAYKTIV